MGHRYIGAKTRILGEIISTIKNIVTPGAHIADLMCGTSAVSGELRKKGYRVTANDLMTYSFHHARVSLLFTKYPTFENARGFIEKFFSKNAKEIFPLTPYELILKALSNVPTVKGYFYREFCVEGSPANTYKPRNYFSPYNAKKIDGIRKWIRKLKETKQIDKLETSLLLHDLIMAANDVANIAGTYGHYMARLSGRAKDKLYLTPTQLLIQNDKGKHKVLRGYSEDVARIIKCHLCYIDPPYMKRQYAANYHILETLAREDNPEAIGVSGLRPWRDQYSNFCSKTKIRDSFRAIFSNMKCNRFLVSYSEDGLLSLEDLRKLFSEFGVIKIRRFNNKRFKSNNSTLSPKLTEYLIYLYKK